MSDHYIISLPPSLPPGRVYELSISSDQRHAITDIYRKTSKAVATASRMKMLTTGEWRVVGVFCVF